MPGPSGSGNGSGRLVLVNPRVVAVLAAAALAGATTAFAALLWLQGKGKSKGKQKPAAAGGYSRGEVRQNSGASPDGREEISKAMDEVSTLREHVDELEESLTRHQQQTAAIIAPLQEELASLKQQLEILHFAADGRLKAPAAGGSATSISHSSHNTNNTDNNTAAIAATNNKRRSGAHDAGAAVLGPGEEMAHLATVALALGVASPGRKGTASSAAADPLGASSSQDGNGYLISDWGDFH